MRFKDSACTAYKLYTRRLSLQDNFEHSCVVGVPCSGVRNFAGVSVSGTNSRQPLPSSCHRRVPAAVVTARAAAPVVGTSLLSSLLRATMASESEERFAYSLNTRGAYIHIGTARLASVRLTANTFASPADVFGGWRTRNVRRARSSC